MTASSLSSRPLVRRSFLAGIAASGLLVLPGCQSVGSFSLTEAIRRLLLASTENAFDRLTAPGGFWDDSVSRLGLNEFLGTRGNALTNILTSTLFKSRLEDAFARFAVDASYRAAPVVTEAVRNVGVVNAEALLRGGPTAATSYLRETMGFALIEAILPEISQALRVTQDPLIGQTLSALAGVDVNTVARGFAGTVSDVIWQEIGREEARIRANPRATNDPVLIGVFGAR
ncbi:DUF4197 domain-containing protein [Altericroceibacterium xinjiangense]|uniref:DUF4197 domain-containing protein n=1 Tax=Altericroceibacterium xinjiangense TaxID=762261 RepID=UPI000F7E1472|nr:DUF4197 domain-containing protein [Altericroceibacterium xinjiangense]